MGRKRVDWVPLQCSNCGGGGEAWNGEDLYICRECHGAGGWWLSENDRLTEYPGGKFCGSAPGAYDDYVSKFQYIEITPRRKRAAMKPARPASLDASCTEPAAAARARRPRPLSRSWLPPR